MGAGELRSELSANPPSARRPPLFGARVPPCPLADGYGWPGACAEGWYEGPGAGG
jgi:hypothetical protein